ncbi:hypothetical protein [Tenuifilum thalassicum]|uniref:Uncharacterized protein n=1 Tax=Tenuifilum thalassicum TaxID=2590900 RepID=A0A7D3XCD0_9BACT|nr:hypothetical protein [Tenuifilum thalassicum]QKG78992.1 hypothetical protein FHG85_01500 [Tenuifilum thalassicum]
MTNFWIILLEIIIALLGAYLVYYARQKGKNQADKEDLKKITETVEDVKQKYTEENELLRANLNILASKKNLLFNEEKEAIINYFGQLNKWIWDGLNVQIVEYNHANFQELSDRLIKMRDDYNKTNIEFSKVQLLVKNEELIQIGHETNLKTLELHHFKESIIQRLQRVLSWEKIMVDQITSKDFDFSKLSVDVKNFYQNQAKEREADKKAIIDEYFAKNQDYFSPAIELRNKFKDLGKKYLNE